MALALVSGVRHLVPLVLGTFLAIVVFLAARAARADEEPPTVHEEHERFLYLEADARYAWTARPPALDVYEAGKNGPRIGGIADRFVQSSSAMQAFGAHLGVVLRPERHLIVPIMGLTISMGTSAYHRVTRNDGLTFEPSDPALVLNVNVVGLGFELGEGETRFSASLRGGFDQFAVWGRVLDPQISEDAVGKSLVFDLHADARLCARPSRDVSARVCLFGGPTIFQGTDAMTGGYAGLGATF
jgi:hypothetical protein